MGPQQLELRDIHLPDTTFSWWPPAIGWWILAIIIPLLCFFIFWLYKRITRKTALKTAKKLLLQIKHDTNLEDKHKLIELSELIRRVAISISPREETASLTGRAWLEYLDSSVKETPFSQGVGRCFADAQYQKTAMIDLDMSLLITLCENWLKAQKEKK